MALLLVCVAAGCLWYVSRCTNPELGVCMLLRDAPGRLDELRASFEARLPPTHHAAFTGAWLVLPEHAEPYAQLLGLVQEGSVVLGLAQPWVAAHGIARVFLADAEDVLPKLLGVPGYSLDLLLEGAMLVVRFRVTPHDTTPPASQLERAMQRLRAPRAATLAREPPIPSVVYVEPPKQSRLELRERTHDTTASTSY